MTFTPTSEQEAVRVAAKSTGQSLMVNAYAGCAKTTTLELAAKEIRIPGLALAFNKSIKEEMAKRFPKNFSVQTMNGLGMASLMRAHPLVNFELDDKKLGKLVTQVSKEWKLELLEDQWAALRELVRKAMQAGLVPKDAGQRPLLPDTLESWKWLSDDMGLSEEDFKYLYEPAQELLRRNNELAAQGTVSYDDQVYYSTCIRGKFPQFPLLLVDEAQDLSPLNHAMLTSAMRPDGRLIACGDSKQAIYAFRGADSDSLGKIEALRRDWVRLPLATTFRCPKLVVARQQSHAPGFRAWEGCRDGEHYRLGRSELDDPFEEKIWILADLMEKAPGPEASIVILCRNNGPLLGMAFKLIKQRVGVTMLGRDIGQGLISLSRKLFPHEDLGVDHMLGVLDEWERTETSLALANEQEEKVDSISDRADCLRAVLEFSDVRDARDLRRALKDLFSREGGRIQLASIHRSKGLEWDMVLHLDPWRIPSKWAKEAARKGDDRQLVQEMNLKYVCETRTRNVLVEANFEEFE